MACDIKIFYQGQWISVTQKELFAMASNGEIDPDTQISVNQKQGFVRQVKGIVFGAKSQNDQKFVMPKFCPMCGQPVQQNMSLSQKFCSSCGYSFFQTPVVALSNPISLSKTPVQKGMSEESQKLLLQLKRDSSDMNLFLKEFFILLLRRNPLNLFRVIYTTAFEKICENTSNEERVTLLNQQFDTMNNICTGLSFEIENENAGGTVFNKAIFDEWLDDVCKGVQITILSYRSDLDKSFPPWRKYVSHIWLDNPEPSITVIRNNITAAFQRTYSSMKTIVRLIVDTARWLCQYAAILSRGIDESDLIGYAAKLYGDVNTFNQYNEMVNSRNELDGICIELLINATRELMDACVAYQEELEATMQPVLTQLLSEVDNISNCTVIGIEKYAKEGNSISAIYNQMHYSSDPVNEDGVTYTKLILQNLVENGLSLQSELNLREMLFSGPRTDKGGK